MALGVEIKCLMASCKSEQKCVTILLWCPHQQKSRYPKLFETARVSASSEGLNSSIAQSASHGL